MEAFVFSFDVPTPEGIQNISLTPGSSVIIVGANGSGKSRLAVEIETNHGLSAHRISAHRMLVLNTDVPKVSEELALEALQLGSNLSRQNIHIDFKNRSDKQLSMFRNNGRWKQKINAPLDDFFSLLQALFAEHANTAVKFLEDSQNGSAPRLVSTKMNLLSAIWERLLPARKLKITADDIAVTPPGTVIEYKASDLSDGERAIFYLIGQTLVAPKDTLLIFDEPELHIHRSIMASLWDELEAVRPDCGFVFITHDLEFAASRSATKFVIREFDGSSWSIFPVPEETGFDEETTTLILGSRRPILFVEGTADSLDYPLYRSCYPNWTVIPKGSCSEVKYAVATLNQNAAFTRIVATGISDADGYEAEEILGLNNAGVKILLVSEIENLILLPEVGRAILAIDAHEEQEIAARLEKLRSAIFSKVQAPGEVEKASLRHARRRIDRQLKLLSFEDFEDIDAMSAAYLTKTSSLDVTGFAKAYADKLRTAISSNNLLAVLSLYDNKGLLADAASILKNQKLTVFKEWFLRIVASGKYPDVNAALRSNLPVLET